ncbi:MAG: PqqD family peptide modification chaperone [Deltaproteobacteria bacterium]|nr:PqqD family peptide modification chaperone [Deltaproteobacteria bacterium]
MLKNIFLQEKFYLPTGLFHKEYSPYHLIMHPTRPVWTFVNDFGWQIVRFLQGDKSFQDILEILVNEYDVKPEILQRDIEDFLVSLKSTGLLEVRERKEDKPAIFTSCFFHITDRCNLRCRHCYYPASASGEDHLTDTQILDYFEAYHNQGGRGFTLSGGEPLLRNGLVKKVISALKDSTFVILTNGILLDDDTARFFNDHQVSVQISLDGSTSKIHDYIRGKGAYDGAIRGIETLLKYSMHDRVNLCATVTRHNISDLKNIIALASGLGIHSVRFLPLRKKGRALRGWNDLNEGLSAEECEAFYDYVFHDAQSEFPDMEISSGLCGYVLNPEQFDEQGNWCPIGNNLVVDSRGNAYACVLLMDQKYRLGSIIKNRLEELWQSPVLAELSSALDERRNKIAECRSCLWKNMCQSGCMGLAYDRFDSIWAKDELCEYRKKIYNRTMTRISEGKRVFYEHFSCNNTKK